MPKKITRSIQSASTEGNVSGNGMDFDNDSQAAGHEPNGNTMYNPERTFASAQPPRQPPEDHNGTAAKNVTFSEACMVIQNGEKSYANLTNASCNSATAYAFDMSLFGECPSRRDEASQMCLLHQNNDQMQNQNAFDDTIFQGLEFETDWVANETTEANNNNSSMLFDVGNSPAEANQSRSRRNTGAQNGHVNGNNEAVKGFIRIMKQDSLPIDAKYGALIGLNSLLEAKTTSVDTLFQSRTLCEAFAKVLEQFPDKAEAVGLALGMVSSAMMSTGCSRDVKKALRASCGPPLKRIANQNKVVAQAARVITVMNSL